MTLTISGIKAEKKRVSTYDLCDLLSDDNVIRQYIGVTMIGDDMLLFSDEYFDFLFSFINKFENSNDVNIYDELLAIFPRIFTFHFMDDCETYVNQFLNILCPKLKDNPESKSFGMIIAAITIGFFFSDDIKYSKIMRMLLEIIDDSEVDDDYSSKKIENAAEAIAYLLAFGHSDRIKEFEESIDNSLLILLKSTDTNVLVKACMLYCAAIENTELHSIREHIDTIRSLGDVPIKSSEKKKLMNIIREVEKVYNDEFKYIFDYNRQKIEYTAYSPYLIIHSFKKIFGDDFSNFVSKSLKFRSLINFSFMDPREIKGELERKKTMQKVEDKRRRKSRNAETRREIYDSYN